MKYLLINIYMLLLLNNVRSQSFWINRNPFLDTLYQSDQVIEQISNTDINHFLPIFHKQIQPSQTIIKNKKGLFILIDGTGQVFQAVDTTSIQILFKRIDSTVYFGNNFASLNFSKTDTLYSFGGYGYWHMNGQLRYFNQGAEWDIKKISKEIPSNNLKSYYSQKDNKIYFIDSKVGEEIAFDEVEEKYQVYELDLKTFKNKLLGKLNKQFNNFDGFSKFIYLPSLNGVLMSIRLDKYLINYKENLVYRLKNENIKKAFHKNSTELIGNFFEKNGKIYFTNYPEYKVFVLPISLSDFSIEPYSVYETEKVNNSVYLFSAFFVLVAFGIILYYFNKKRFPELKISNIVDTIESVPNDNNDFSNIEIQLINLIIECNSNSSQLTMEKINNTLGISRKSVEVQKKVRGDTINRINHKFKVLFNSQAIFIERYRSENDRRSYDYVINNQNKNIYTKLIAQRKTK